MELELDDSICTVMDYFEIFLGRMLMCKRAAEKLNCKFKLIANGSKLCLYRTGNVTGDETLCKRCTSPVTFLFRSQQFFDADQLHA